MALKLSMPRALYDRSQPLIDGRVKRAMLECALQRIDHQETYAGRYVSSKYVGDLEKNVQAVKSFKLFHCTLRRG